MGAFPSEPRLFPSSRVPTVGRALPMSHDSHHRAGLSPEPHSVVAGGRDGVYVRCDGCGSLLRFLIRARDGRDLCKRCLDALGKGA